MSLGNLQADISQFILFTSLIIAASSKIIYQLNTGLRYSLSNKYRIKI